jgi:hypothetical protein
VALFRRTSREARFWEWFARNSDRLLSFEADREAVFDDLQRALAKVQPDLVFEFGPLSDGRRTFVVSADGIRQNFPAVVDLVAAAPELPAWHVLAFRQPMDSIPRVELADGTGLRAEDVWFLDEPQGELVGLHLFVRDLTPQNASAVQRVLYLLLDAALGEYDVETRVGFIDPRPLPDDPAELGLKRLDTLRSVVEQRAT